MRTMSFFCIVFSYRKCIRFRIKFGQNYGNCNAGKDAFKNKRNIKVNLTYNLTSQKCKFHNEKKKSILLRCVKFSDKTFRTGLYFRTNVAPNKGWGWGI